MKKFALLVVAGVAIVLGTHVLAPDLLADTFAKEGASEHLQHVLLGAAVVAWAAMMVAARPFSWWLVAAVAYLAIVTAEELDWGSLYGGSAASEHLTRWMGRPNTHNALGGASYLIFGIPLIAYVALATPYASSSARAALGVGAPTRGEALALVGVVLVTAIASGLVRELESVLDEMKELGLYAVLLAIPLRRAVGLGRPART